MQIRLVLRLAAALAAAMVSGRGLSAEGPRTIGYRGDGTCVARNSHPPLEWDEKTGRNILWKVPMPNWGWGTPVAVKDRVFVISEHGWTHDWPLLQCFDAGSGRLVWEKELNHLAATGLAADRQATIAAAWKALNAFYRDFYKAVFLWNQGTDQGRRQARALVARHGLAIEWDDGAEIREYAMKILKGSAAGLKPLQDRWKEVGQAGLTGESWRHHLGGGLMCIGHSFPTPVSDGERLYVANAFGAFYAFDLDGKILWQAFLPGAGAGDYCSRGRSPILYRDLLISDLDGVVRGIDRATGKLRWQHTLGGRAYHTVVSPAVLTTGGKDVLLCGGKDTSGGELGLHAFGLPEGKPLTIQGWGNPGGTALAKYDEPDVVFFTGGGEHGGWEAKGRCDAPPPAAVRFALQGDTLKAKVLWAGIDGAPVSSHTGITYYEGRLYHAAGVILDAATGKVLAGNVGGKRGGPGAAVPRTRHLLWVAGGHVYGLASAGGRGETADAVAEVFTLDGKPAARNLMFDAPVEGEKVEQIVTQDSPRMRDLKVPRWREWSNGFPFTIAGDRIYIRSADYLYAVGEKK